MAKKKTDSNKALQLSAEMIAEEQAAKKKKRRKITLWTLIVCVPALAIAILSVVYPNRLIEYNSALELKSEGKYEEAGKVFLSLQDFKDSAAQYAECFKLLYDNDGLIVVTKEDVPYFAIGETGNISINNTYYGDVPNELVIPDIIDGIKINTIAAHAFSDCTGLTSITIPENVTSIGEGAFEGCKINAVHISSIESWFNISFGDYDSNPLYNAENLYHNGDLVTEITVPDTFKSINNYAFYNCKSLTSITIPENVRSIGDSAFYGCTGLTSVTISENVTSIGDSAFYGCTGLTSITIPESVISIGDKAFYGCILNAVHISSIKRWLKIKFESYYSNPLYNAENLYLNGDLVTEITVPDTFKSINNYALYNCKSLTSISIPESVTSIGDRAFYGCTLNAVHISSVESWFNISFGDYYSNPLHNAENLYLNGSLVTEVTVSDTVKSINDYAFLHYKGLTSITFAEGGQLEKIGAYAFSGCLGIKSITIPESVTSIDSSAFFGCRIEEATITTDHISSIRDINLKVLNFIGGTRIETSAFEGCTSLTNVTFAEGCQLKEIDTSAFEGCTSLTSVAFAEGSLIENISNYAFRGCTSLSSVTIPESVAKIEERAFSDCPIEEANIASNHISSIALSNLKKVVITGGSGIGAYAFRDCKSLTSITIPEIVTSIGNGAFEGCTSLTSITIPESVTSIGNGAFEDCTSLTSIIIPESVISIGDSAFSGCMFNAVHISDIESWLNIRFSDSSSNPLYNAGNLYLNGNLVIEVTVPDTITSINDYTFYNCTSLTSITIPESVTSIGNGAFEGCTSLTSIVFEDADNWCNTVNLDDFSNKTGGTLTDVSDAALNAVNFNETYSNYYWYKSE